MSQNVNDLHLHTLTFSERFAQWITSKVGTMYFFYLTVVIAMSPLWFPQYLVLIQFISSSFLQLVLLPLIMISQNLQDRRNGIEAENDYGVDLKTAEEISSLHAKIDMLLKNYADTTADHELSRAKQNL